jgi:uncharacterized Zn finger protein (UPF0148 family)
MNKEGTPCAVCLAPLPELAGICYCPYCGAILAAPEDGLHEEAAIVAAPKRSLEEQQRAVREKYEHLLQDPRVKISTPADIYTLILKGCDNKEALIECLDQVLTRGEKAIRLAVTTMPAVLLYKANQAIIDTVANVLRDAEAVYAVVEGSFDYSSFYKSPHFTRLDSASKAVLKSVPKNMWPGENIKFISDDIYFEGNRGYGVFSDNAFFFFWIDKSVNHAVLPVSLLDTIDTWEDEGRYLGEWINSDGRTFKMEFTRKEDFDVVRDLSWG